MTIDIKSLQVAPSQTIREIMKKIESGHQGAVVVVDEVGKLIGIITDGDIRRAVLTSVNLDRKVGEILLCDANGAPMQPPVTMPANASRAELVELISATKLRHIPLVNDHGQPVALATMESVFKETEENMSALVMAGGFGTRLRPLTDSIPKPMLKVGDQPLLERIVAQLKEENVCDINISTYYKHEAITEHFQNGEAMGVNIRYLKEDVPLGTAGILSHFNNTDRRILVINGDILTKVSFRAMMAFHISHDAALTVACRLHEVQIPYGELEIQGVNISGIREKPVHRYFVNAGIYIIEPELIKLVPKDTPYQMPELIEATLQQGKHVVSFPITEYWRDIGHMDDFQQAVADVGAWSKGKAI